jgi:hypothetical protein
MLAPRFFMSSAWRGERPTAASPPAPLPRDDARERGERHKDTSPPAPLPRDDARERGERHKDTSPPAPLHGVERGERQRQRHELFRPWPSTSCVGRGTAQGHLTPGPSAWNGEGGTAGATARTVPPLALSLAAPRGGGDGTRTPHPRPLSMGWRGGNGEGTILPHPDDPADRAPLLRCAEARGDGIRQAGQVRPLPTAERRNGGTAYGRAGWGPEAAAQPPLPIRPLRRTPAPTPVVVPGEGRGGPSL